MKPILLLILTALIFALNTSAKEKYFIFFIDKGITEETFNTQDKIFFKSQVQLSEKAIERRKKVLGENYIRFIDIPLNETYISEIENRGIKIEKRLKWFNAVSAYLSESEISKISGLSFIQRIEKVKLLPAKRNDQLKSSSSENYFQSLKYSLDYGKSLAQNELHHIPIVHDAGFNGQDVIIGFLDSGFNWKEHPALKNLDVLYEYDYVQDDDITSDQPGDAPGQDGHGTAVFSIGAGFDNGNLIGPAYGASFFLAKTENIAIESHVEEDNFAKAVEDFEMMGVDIITASLGYSIFDPGEGSYTYQDMNGNTTIVTKAYNYAYELGVITVIAAGNEGQSSWGHIIAPSDAFNVISVGNIDKNGLLNSTSSRGPTADGRIKPEVTAVGTRNFHAASGGGYNDFGSGTSFSAPMAAGMIAQLLSAYPYLTNDQVRDIVLQSGDNYETPNNDVGYGRMSILRALNTPNIWQYDSNLYRINKMFLSEDILFDEDFRIYYKKENYDWQFFNFEESSSGYYTFDVPEIFITGDTISFYYTYRTTGNQLVREPQDKNYTFVLSPVNHREEREPLTNTFLLYQNYPNPFNSQTRIEFESPKSDYAQVIIYNILGQQIKELFNGVVVKGITKLSWDGTDNSGRNVATGPYLYSVKINGQVLSKKMMLLK